MSGQSNIESLQSYSDSSIDSKDFTDSQSEIEEYVLTESSSDSSLDNSSTSVYSEKLESLTAVFYNFDTGL